MDILVLEGTGLVSRLRELGHRVLTVGHAFRRVPLDVKIERPLYYRGLMELFTERDFAPELVLWCDTGYPPIIFGLERLEAVLVAYSVDSYCNPWHVPMSQAFDLALVAQKDYLDVFQDNESGEQGRPARWLPLYSDEERDLDPGCERDIPVSFVGTLKPRNIPERLPFLESFRKLHPIVIHQGDFRPIFGRSRLVLNQSAAGELNYRLFEAAAMGAAVLTEDVGNGLGELFTPGEELLVYPRGDARAAAAVAAGALAHPEALAELARRGRDKVRRLHTSRVRAGQVLELAGLPEVKQARRRRLANLGKARVRVETACAFLASDLGDDQAELRRLYTDLAASYRRLWNKL